MNAAKFAITVLALALLSSACADAVGSDGVGLDPASPITTTEQPPSTAPGEPDPGDGTAMCAPEVPDCVDVVTEEPVAADCEPPCDDTEGDPPLDHVETPIVATEGTPRARPFESATAGDGNTLVVRWWSGVEPCTALAAVEVEETDTTVTVTISEASVHPDDAEVACIEIAQAKQHTVTLDAPVGDRRVVDGAA